MKATILVAAFSLCGGCAVQMPWSIPDAPSLLRRPDAVAIAGACNQADRRLTSVDASFLSYVVRYPRCTTDRTKRGDVQCRFELGETRVAPGEAQSRAERRVRRWRPALASFTYSEHHFSDPGGDGWIEFWTVVGRCRPLN